MPDGSITHETERHDLKTLKDGYVVLQQLPYYKMLERRDKGSIASMEQQTQGRKRGEPLTTKMVFESLQTWEKWFMFSNFIVDHNITNRDGEMFDFTKQQTLHFLRPDIGMEIERLIDDINSEGDAFQEDFPHVASNSSEQQTPELAILPEDTPTS